MAKVVITGGTGFLGPKLVARLAARGDEVVVLARNVTEGQRRVGGNARVLAWSLEGASRAAWEAEVRGAKVVNLAGAGVMDEAWTDARKRELRASRIETTQALAEALASGDTDARARSVFVSASAIGIYGTHEDGALLTEDSPHGSDFLAELCVAWEAAAQRARDAGVRVVHPRLGIVLGNDGGALPDTARPFRLHAGGPIGRGDQWVSWIHEQDVLGGLALALDDTSMVGPYNFVAPHPVTMNAEAEAIARALGTHARLRVPALALKAILGSGRAGVVLTGQRVSARRLIDAGYAFAFTEVGAAMQDLLGSPRPARPASDARPSASA